jgi:hypothetical protein
MFSVFLVVNLIIPVISAKKYAANVAFRQTGEGNAFSNVSFTTRDGRGRNISLTSDRIYESQKDHFIYENTTVNFTMSSEENGTICSDITKAIRSDKTICELLGHVELKTDKGLLIKTEKSLVDFNKKAISGDADITIVRGNITASSRRYFFDMNENILTLKSEAKCIMCEDSVTAEEIIIHFNGWDEKNTKSILAIGNASYVSANYSLSAKHAIRFQGNNINADDEVVLFYKRNGNNYQIKSDHMRATLNKNGTIGDVEANGSLIIKEKSATIRANRGIFRNEKITAHGNVVITGKNGDIFGDTAVLDINTGGVMMSNCSGIVADGRCDR